MQGAASSSTLLVCVCICVYSAEFSAVLEGSVDRGFSLLSRQLADIHHSAAQR